MIEEMTDRYGDTPAPLIRLMDVALLRRSPSGMASFHRAERKQNPVYHEPTGESSR